jgi:RNA polymerase sigma factor (sigma-70 family)
VGGRDKHDEGFDGSDLVARHYPLVLRVIRSIAHRHRLSPEESDELRSLVHLKLVDDDFLVFRKFQGRSSLSTYLTKVIWRICLDERNAAWGKWRSSAQARRQGSTAIRLERLLYRDGLPFDEACALLLATYRVAETSDALERIRDTLPRRQRVRVYGQDALDALPPSALASSSPYGSDDETREALTRKLAVALASLPPGDRRLLQLRYQEGCTIARVATKLRLDQKRAYREFERVHRALRAMLVGGDGRSTAKRTAPRSMAHGGGRTAVLSTAAAAVAMSASSSASETERRT